MTIKEFSNYDLKRQTAALLSATFLMSRDCNKIFYQLFYLYNFFVELIFFKQEGRITMLHPFAEDILLEPYLDLISIEDLSVR